MDCKNHPGIPAKRKCYHCKDPVCSVCQVRGAGHIFCSEKCEEAYSKNKPEMWEEKTETEATAILTGTPHVDSAYAKAQVPIAIRNINLETFEAIQSIIDKTDSELKLYLKDLELIFESTTGDSLKEFKDYMDNRWGSLDQSLEGFKKSIERSARELSSLEENFIKSHSYNTDSLKS